MRESDGEPKNNPGSFVPFCHTARPHAPCPRCVPVTRHVQDSTCCPHPQFHSNNNEDQFLEIGFFDFARYAALRYTGRSTQGVGILEQILAIFYVFVQGDVAAVRQAGILRGILPKLILWNRAKKALLWAVLSK